MENKNRIIVSGLPPLKDSVSPYEGNCISCNYDLGWLFQHPSTLIWSDSIIITPEVLKYIKKETSPYGRSKSWGIIARIFFEVADNLGIMEVKDPAGILSPKFFDVTMAKIAKECLLLQKSFPNAVRTFHDDKAPGAFTINNQHYCSPRIISFYTSLALSRIWKAQLLLNQKWEVYLRYLLALQAHKDIDITSKLRSFQKVFTYFIPESSVLPPEAYKKCKSCDRLAKCDLKAISQVEGELKKYSILRKYDEIQDLKLILNQITIRADENLDPLKIKSEFSNIQKRLQKQIRKIFPNTSHWSKTETMLSIPVITGTSPTRDADWILQKAKKNIAVFRSEKRWVYFKQMDE